MRLFELMTESKWKDTDSFVGRKVRRAYNGSEHANKFGTIVRHELTVEPVQGPIISGHESRYTIEYDDGTVEIPSGPSSFEFIEELEEIKVTKTLAGRRQSPSRQLAMKNKKKSPNQGKKAVELDKNPTAKDLANITLKGEYNQHTK